MSNHGRATASRFLVDTLLGAAARLGVAVGDLGVEPPPAGRPFPLSSLARLWPAVADATGPAPGLALAEAVHAERWDAFGRAVGSSATLGDALVRAGRFMPLLVEGVDLGLAVSGARSTITYRGWVVGTQHPDTVAFALGIITRCGRHVTGGRFRPHGVSLVSEAPRDVAPYEEFFGVRPEFGRPLDALVVDSHLLHGRIPGYDAALCGMAEHAAQEALSAMVRVQSVARRTEEALRRELEECFRAPTVDRVAATLGIPPRTLSRHLKAEGTTFQEILDARRHHLADRYLSESCMSIGEVALALGYSDPSAFNKAFRRWTGRAPHEYRRRVSEAPPVSLVRTSQSP